MMTSSNRNIFHVTGPLFGEFTGHRWIPRTKASDAKLWCFLWSVPEWRLSKQPWGWWFDTPSSPLWRHCNGLKLLSIIIKGWLCECMHANVYRYKTLALWLKKQISIIWQHLTQQISGGWRLRKIRVSTRNKTLATLLDCYCSIWKIISLEENIIWLVLLVVDNGYVNRIDYSKPKKIRYITRITVDKTFYAFRCFVRQILQNGSQRAPMIMLWFSQTFDLIYLI